MDLLKSDLNSASSIAQLNLQSEMEGTIECGLETPQTKPKMSTKPYQGQADVSKVILFVR